MSAILFPVKLTVLGANQVCVSDMLHNHQGYTHMVNMNALSYK